MDDQSRLRIVGQPWAVGRADPVPFDPYAQDAVMIADGDVYRGREAMRPLFERSRDASIIDMDLSVDVAEAGDVVYASWRAKRDGEPDLVGTDTFVITHGAITTHTGFHSPVGCDRPIAARSPTQTERSSPPPRAVGVATRAHVRPR